MSINVVALSGRLAADPELTYTPAGKACCNFRIAVQRNFKNEATGEYDADFFSGTAWGTSAEFLANHAHQGDLVGVEGRLQNREWVHPEFGNKVTSTSVQCNSVDILARKGQNADGSPIERREAAPVSQEGAQRRQGPPPVGQTRQAPVVNQQQEAPAAQQQVRTPAPRPASPPPADSFDVDPFADE